MPCKRKNRCSPSGWVPMYLDEGLFSLDKGVRGPREASLAYDMFASLVLLV
jgi:hypothetical protein